MQKNPNIVLIVADDMGYVDFGVTTMVQRGLRVSMHWSKMEFV